MNINSKKLTIEHSVSKIFIENMTWYNLNDISKDLNFTHDTFKMFARYIPFECVKVLEKKTYVNMKGLLCALENYCCSPFHDNDELEYYFKVKE